VKEMVIESQELAVAISAVRCTKHPRAALLQESSPLFQEHHCTITLSCPECEQEIISVEIKEHCEE
jgi:hypothetical protein